MSLQVRDSGVVSMIVMVELLLPPIGTGGRGLVALG